MRLMKKRVVVLVLSVVLIVFSVHVLVYMQIIPKKTYSNKDFNIQDFRSHYDYDQDGIEDQADILLSVRTYLDTKPQYKSKYYGTGYPDDQYGVCTDVVAFGLLGAGYDLKTLLNQDVKANRDVYTINQVDKNIDFRRVGNLHVFFKRHAQSLTLDLNEIGQWQGGDIVVFKKHIGIVSDKRNKKGIPYLIHHGRVGQFRYEEDVLEAYQSTIVGHYRVAQPLRIDSLSD